MNPNHVGMMTKQKQLHAVKEYEFRFARFIATKIWVCLALHQSLLSQLGPSGYQIFTTQLSWPRELTIAVIITCFQSNLSWTLCSVSFFGKCITSKYECREMERESVNITVKKKKASRWTCNQKMHKAEYFLWLELLKFEYLFGFGTSNLNKSS